MAILCALAPGLVLAQDERQIERTVTSVGFEGNHALDDYTLSIAIATSASTWTYRWPILRGLRLGQRRIFDELEFRRDVVRLQLLYRQHGYFEARVDTTVRRDGRSVAVRFRIAEGSPVLVDSVGVAGADSIVDRARLIRRLPLQEGHPFDRFLFEASADTLVLALRNEGYPFATVFRNYQVDRPTQLARVDYVVVPGPRARVGDVEITGSHAVTGRTIRRSLAIREGDLFRQDALYDTQRSLYQTDLFRFASVGVAPDSTVAGADSLVRILVRVADGSRTRLRAGIGYGTLDCFRAQTTVTASNFMGGARRLELAGKVSKLAFAYPTDFGLRDALCPVLRSERDPFSDTLNYFASLTFTQPALLARRNALSLTGFAERRSEFKVFERIGVGAAAAVTFGVARDVPVTATYRVTNGRTNASAGNFCVYFNRCEQSAVALLSETRRVATLGISIADARADAPLDPTTGYNYSLEATHAASAVGSEFVFDKLLGEAAAYGRLGRGWVVAVRVRGGIVHPGLSQVADSSIRFVPPEERFYAGGASTVRGFGTNEMGPVVYVATAADTNPTTGEVAYRDLRASPTGSNAIALANLELRFPSPIWPSRLRLAAFVDAGQLWNQTTGGLVPTPRRFTPGLGLRFSTPLGPMRLDAAYNDYERQSGPLYIINSSSGTLDLMDPSYRGPSRGGSFLRRIQLHFSVGQPF